MGSPNPLPISISVDYDPICTKIGENIRPGLFTYTANGRKIGLAAQLPDLGLKTAWTFEASSLAIFCLFELIILV